MGLCLRWLEVWGKKRMYCFLPLVMHPLDLFEGVVGCLELRGEAALVRTEVGMSGEAGTWASSGWRHRTQKRKPMKLTLLTLAKVLLLSC